MLISVTINQIPEVDTYRNRIVFQRGQSRMLTLIGRDLKLRVYFTHEYYSPDASQ
jgi:hypothetical protein